MQICYATKNQGKLSSLRREFEPYKVEIRQVELDLPEPRSSDVAEIAEHKVGIAYSQLKKPTIVSDAGFYIRSLNGFPRAYVNFALETIGLEGILKLIEDKERDCESRDCLAFLDGSLKDPKLFLGQVKGTFAYTPRGQMQKHLWSELSLIFIPEGSNKTQAEMTYEEYLSWRKLSREKESPSRKLLEWLIATARLPSF